MIEINKLSKWYGNKQVLFDIELQLEAGNVYGIVGKNGAGKTTLFKCIAGLEHHTGIIKSPYSILKNHIGLLETHPLFMSRITGWEYLKLVCLARNITTDDFEQQNIFDLPLNLYADTYSTGMKKKLALMGILLQKNDLFILDEPFNGVDIQSNILILELIAELKKKQKTILIASHILITLKEVCDSIFHLKEGTISKEVKPKNYDALEKEIKESIIGDKIKNINIE